MYYFAYGSNLLRRRIEERLGPVGLKGIGYLPGYCLEFHKLSRDSSGKCTVYRTKREVDRVYGVVLELTSAQKTILDKIEGPGYDSVSVLIQSDSGGVKTETYIAKTTHIDACLIPFDWYKAFVVAGATEAGLSREYISTLEKTPSIEDFEPDRSQLNWSLLLN